MASLTSQLGFMDEHMGFNQAQNQGLQAYLYHGLGLLELSTVPPVTVPGFTGPTLDFLLITVNTIGRAVLV